jgi:hypothetical protein
MVDSKGDFQGQDRELQGIFREICAGGSGGLILPSRDGPHHGRNNTTSRPFVHHWAGGYGPNWNVRCTISIAKDLYLFSRCQDSGCAGGNGKIFFSSTDARTDDFFQGRNWRLSRSRLPYCAGGYGPIWADKSPPPPISSMQSLCSKCQIPGYTGGYAQN